MKFNAPLLVFDLECTSNQVLAEVRPAHQTNDYIIDFGATLLVQDSNGDLVVEDSFGILVKPEETITPFIENMTHITNEMVKNAPLWPKASAEIESWLNTKVKNIKGLRLGAWGNYFDVPMLRKMYDKYNLKYPFAGTALDCKTIAAMYYALSGRGIKDLSVESCAKDLGIFPEGAYHRADVDAQVTAEIVMKCVNDLNRGHFVNVKQGMPYKYIKIGG